MARRHKVVQNDTDVALTIDLIDRASGEPLDVSGATVVRLYTRAEGSSVILDTVEGDKLTGRRLPDGTLDATVAVPGQGGRVVFNMPTSFTARDPGLYEGEIEITFESGLIQTVYDLAKFSIRPDF